jgi:S-adenosylmethionine:tRNA ribosyltransferase-isomerase
MLISEFDYKLPDELIAQNPLEKREVSRMLVIDKKSAGLRDERFFSFPKYLKKGDVVVINNTKVFPARLFGRSETGAKIELFLVEEIKNGIWETLGRPGKRLKPGKKIFFGEKLSAEVLEKTSAGRVMIKFDWTGDFEEILDEIGQTPLPPSINREEGAADKDRNRYQTVYARNRGAIAAPTAGLHFTPDILDEIRSIGAAITEITLHVGYGTFEPVRVEDLAGHRVMEEKFEIAEESAAVLNQARSEGRRIIAVGTTSTRALETTFSKYDTFKIGKQVADLTITPGYRFKAITGLLTNFHLPQSSLLVLVSTFGGYDLIMNAYQHAVREKYRFYSYGDCMFVF